MTLTEYEMERKKRMEENKRRLEQLGLPKMAEEMTAAQTAAAEAVPRKKRERRAPEVLEASRKSVRNEGKERPKYTYDLERVPGEPRMRDGPLVKDGECPEVYGVEHVQALGSYQKEWEMFTDGYTSQGERIYDNEKGASCHQCRQKTLGQRTCCSRCKSGLGMLCGDCLFARYGENVEEAVANKDWVCPCCRDLCNCSTHRKKRRWEATGALHRSVKARGYLSGAHYLVLNKAGGLAAKRAALASGLCPEELEEKLREEVAELELLPEEEQEAGAPAALLPVPTPAEEEGQAATAGGQEGQAKPKRQRKKPAAGDAEGKKARKAGGAAGEAAAQAEEAPGGKKASGSKKQRKQQEAAAAGGAAAGGGNKKQQKQGGKPEERAGGRQEAGAKPVAQRKRKSAGSAAEQPAAVPAAAAAGMLETSGASGGAVAGAASPAAGEVEVSAPAPAAPAVISLKAPFSRHGKGFGKAKRVSAAAASEAALAARA
ncbi:Cell division cycle-associated 7 [Micractinium conductrix]|uniref:Cell division cycle-associated 7 n=1 Tax=Micractinium conductrix TaxID=554055 RepID=A0A2P6V3A2_9CHLO|nr:Cell division cycle-associated 7 [Micractinium conductrix]|eukprot:PSC68566.1 Cell division cycle-associated 7 [Micractinium conductrix]